MPHNGVVPYAPQVEDFNTVKLIFKGVIEGFLEKEAPEVMSCLKDANSAMYDFKYAVGDFEKKTVKGVEQGLHELAEGLDSLKDAMTDCGSAYNDVELLVSAMKSLSSPWSLVVHVGKEIVVNHKDIFHHVEGAISNWKGQSYERFGEDIGAIVADLCGTKELPV